MVDVLVLVLPVICVAGGFILAGLAIHRRTRLNELAYRERIAMIERGLMPSPERDPARFEAALEKTGRGSRTDPTELGRARRRRDAGVTLIGLGLGLALLILGTVRDLSLAIGLGGAFAMLGAAYVVNGFMMIRDAQGMPVPQRLDDRHAPPT